MNYLGDIPQDQTLYVAWATCDSTGASITRATNGTISVYKDDGTTQSTAGVTDTEDFDSLTGVHMLKLVTTDSFYASAHDYAIVLSGAVINGKTVNTVIALFSIENRTGSPQAGALEITYTLKIDDEDTGEVLEGADVWITTDEAGSNIIWRGVTDASGVLRETAGSSKPWLDAGTYYFWRQKSGYTFSNPDTETFS